MAMRKAILEKNLDALSKMHGKEHAKEKRAKRQKLTQRVQKEVIAILKERFNYTHPAYTFEFPNFKLKPTGNIRVIVKHSNWGWGDMFATSVPQYSHVAEHAISMNELYSR